MIDYPGRFGVYILILSPQKNLYVGITRVRSRLWILESNEKAVKPVIRLFNEVAPALLSRSNPEPFIEVLREDEIGVRFSLLMRFACPNYIRSLNYRTGFA
jgi:hypothetical protein